MDRCASPSTTSSRAPPFSLVEFGNLVSAALESPDPILYSDASTFFSLPNGSRCGTPAGSEQSGSSRVRQMLQKFKKRASSLVKRPSTRRLSSLRASSPEYQIPELSLSSEGEFAPYMPLVTQYERRTPYVRPISTCMSTPSLPSQYTLELSHYGTSSLSSSHSYSIPSPSTSDSSCCSSTGTSSESQHPTTPLNTVFEECAIRRWSHCSTETDETPSDPFTHPFHSGQPRASASVGSLPHPLRLRRYRSQRALSPAKPPPTRPIPPLPLPTKHSSYSRHPYSRATPIVPASPASPTPGLRRRSSAYILDEFPAPPLHTPTPSPPITPPRCSRASSPNPFPLGFTPPYYKARANWLDLSSSSPSSMGSAVLASPASGRSYASDESEPYHSACSGSSSLWAAASFAS